MREGERVTPLELFFDLVFVLALTQCTALMYHHPTWEGLAQGMLVLGVLWWSWTGYAWLTSVVDPEEGAVRIAMFAAMASFLLVAICVPEAFDSLALEFALAYGAVRAAHIALFILASREDPALRRSTVGLAAGTAIGVRLLLAASLFDGLAQAAVWSLALFLDMAEPFFFGSEGWKLVPGHFAERHGLIIIIALGESIVAIGAGAEASLTAGIAAAAVLGVTVAAALWWTYFDVVALVSARRLARAPEGRERNELARDSYSYLHFPMVAGIVLSALAFEQAVHHGGDPLDSVNAAALFGGTALYLLGHVAFRWRQVHSLSRQRSLAALGAILLYPVALHVPALLTPALVLVLLCVLIVYEVTRFAETRERVRHELARGQVPAALAEIARMSE